MYRASPYGAFFSRSCFLAFGGGMFVSFLYASCVGGLIVLFSCSKQIEIFPVVLVKRGNYGFRVALRVRGFG